MLLEISAGGLGSALEAGVGTIDGGLGGDEDRATGPSGLGGDEEAPAPIRRESTERPLVKPLAVDVLEAEVELVPDHADDAGLALWLACCSQALVLSYTLFARFGRSRIPY